MHLEPPGRPIPDPFFAALRRRHRDVDLVVLPPESRPVDPTVSTAEISDEALAETRSRLTQVLHDLWATTAPVDREEPATSLRYGDVESQVRVRSRVTAERADGAEVLARLGSELEERGWSVRRRPGVVEQLSAAREGLGLRATYAAGSDAVVVTLSSEPVHVGVERARALVRAGGR